MSKQVTVNNPANNKQNNYRRNYKKKKNYKNNKQNNPAPAQQKPVEIKEDISSLKTEEDKQKYMLKLYRETVQQAFNSLQINPITKDRTLTYTQYNKNNYRTYIQNPKNNEENLRQMSQFLARVCTPYNRILWYYATIPMFYWNLTPRINPAEEVDSEGILNEYYQIANNIENLRLSQSMRQLIYLALRDGAFYGVIYDNSESENIDTTNGEGFFIQKLDPRYCKPVALQNGVWNFAFDLSYFTNNTNREFLKVWDPMFQEAYNLYQQDTTNNKWQILDPKKTICIKADPSNYNETLPFFVGMFEGLLDLIDARTLQRNRDIVENYKMIIQKIPLVKEANSIDEFSIELDTAIRFYNMMLNALPEGVGAAMSPMDTDTIDFKPDDNSASVLANAMNALFDDSGVSEMLFNSNKSGSVGLDASIKTDIALSWQLVESIEQWVQRYIDFKELTYQYDFEILRVDIFNKDKSITSELSLANSGIPNKMKLAATAGITPVRLLSAMTFENDILGLHAKFIPLQTSYTMSSDSATNEKEIEDLTDAGAKSRDGEVNKTEV